MDHVNTVHGCPAVREIRNRWGAKGAEKPAGCAVRLCRQASSPDSGPSDPVRKGREADGMVDRKPVHSPANKTLFALWERLLDGAGAPSRAQPDPAVRPFRLRGSGVPQTPPGSRG